VRVETVTSAGHPTTEKKTDEKKKSVLSVDV
jgi:hypothetical protein